MIWRSIVIGRGPPGREYRARNTFKRYGPHSKCLRRHDWSTLWLTQWNKTSRVHIRHSGCHSWLYDGRKKARTKPTQTRRTMMMEEDEEEEEEQKRTNWGRRGGRRAGRRPEEEKIARGGAWVQTNKKIGAKEQDRDSHKQTTKQANRTIQKTDLNPLQIGLHIMLISCAFSYPYSFWTDHFCPFQCFCDGQQIEPNRGEDSLPLKPGINDPRALTQTSVAYHRWW